MKNIAIIIADEKEFVPYKALSSETLSFLGMPMVTFEKGDSKITAVQCGIGKVNAAMTAAALLSKDKFDFVLNAGLSGAVKGLRREDIVTGTSYVECDFDLSAIGFEKGFKPGQNNIYTADENLLTQAKTISGIKSAKCGTGDLFLTDENVKKEYNELFGIECFDMESAAIASVCEKFEVPFLSVRKISDDSADTAGEDYRQMNDLCQSDLCEILLEVIRLGS